MKKMFFIVIVLCSLAACTKSDSGSIFGTASADGGNIVSGITVKLYTMDVELYSTTTTDSQGNFTFNNVETGNYYIGATVSSGGETYDTGNIQQIVYVSGEIEKEVALTLTKR